jgi:hypothetical protein
VASEAALPLLGPEQRGQVLAAALAALDLTLVLVRAGGAFRP